MDKLISCELNIDTGCVELLYADGSTISIDYTGVEEVIDATIYSRAEMDWLIYNDRLFYAQMVFNGTLEDYLKRVSGKHSPDTDNTC